MKRSSHVWSGSDGTGDDAREIRAYEEDIVWLDSRRPRAWGGPRPEGKPNQKRALGPLERELHDTVLQDLLCLGIGLGSLRSVPLDDATRQEVIHLQQVATQAYEQLRALLNGQGPSGAPPRRMREVLASCVRTFNEKSGAQAELEVRESAGTLLVSGEAVRHAEMIIQEALHNAWRHGRAKSIKVVLTETADIIWVKVIDDGRGFDTSVRKAGHYGLRIMRERAEAIGARIGITSSLGKGTCVNLYIPSHHSPVSTVQEVSDGYSAAGRR